MYSMIDLKICKKYAKIYTNAGVSWMSTWQEIYEIDARKDDANCKHTKRPHRKTWTELLNPLFLYIWWQFSTALQN